MIELRKIQLYIEERILNHLGGMAAIINDHYSTDFEVPVSVSDLLHEGLRNMFHNWADNCELEDFNYELAAVNTLFELADKLGLKLDPVVEKYRDVDVVGHNSIPMEEDDEDTH